MADMTSGGTLQQAQHIWQMLDDMAENDPQAYKRFIDKQLKDGKECFQPPTPHMCVQTKIIDSCVLYINICEWPKIPEPKSDEDPIPVVGGYLYNGQDKNGEHKLITVAFNPAVLEQFGRHSPLREERKLLINLAIDYIQDQHNLKLSRSYSVLPEKTLFKGPKEQVANSLLNKFRSGSKEQDEFQHKMAELEKSFGPITPLSKDSLLEEMSRISLNNQSEIDTESYESSGSPVIDISNNDQTAVPKGKCLIEEVSSTENTRTEPHFDLVVTDHENNLSQTIVLKINLPGVKTVAQCELDISEEDIHLEAGDLYELKVQLPKKVDDLNATARFNRKSSSLTITLPVSS